MKFLLDMPVSRTLLSVLERLGHQGAHANDRGLARATDQELLDLARHEGRVIVTADLDFPRLLVMSRSAGPGLILFRGGSFSDEDMRLLLEKVLHAIAPEILPSSICVVDKNRIRITRLPLLGEAPGEPSA